MSLKFRFKIDGTEMNNPPMNWEDFTIGIRRSFDVAGVVFEYPTNIEVFGLDYDTLFAKVENNTPASNLDFLVEYTTDSSTYSTLFEGFIVPTDIRFKPFKRTASFVVEDTTFSGLINSKKDLLIPTDETTSLNGEVIAPPTVYSRTTNYLSFGYEWSELIQFVFDYLTDGVVDVVDNWYPNLDEYPVVSNDEGFLVFSSGITPFNVSFSSLWVPMARLYNLQFNQVLTSGERTFTIDEFDDCYSSLVAVSLTGTDLDIEIYMDQSKLYGFVEVGDSVTPYNSINYAIDGTYVGSSFGFIHRTIETPYKGCKSNRFKIQSSGPFLNEAVLDIKAKASYADQHTFPSIDKESLKFIHTSYNDVNKTYTNIGEASFSPFTADFPVIYIAEEHSATTGYLRGVKEFKEGFSNLAEHNGIGLIHIII